MKEKHAKMKSDIDERVNYQSEELEEAQLTSLHKEMLYHARMAVTFDSNIRYYLDKCLLSKEFFNQFKIEKPKTEKRKTAKVTKVSSKTNMDMSTIEGKANFL